MTKQITVSCENCGKELKTEKKFVGRKGRCPHCGSVIRLYRDKESGATGKVESVVQKEKIKTGEDSLLDVTMQNDVGVVSFRTSRILDQSNVQQLGDEFSALLSEAGLKKMVLNFSNVHYMSSAVMGKLVRLQKQLDERGGELRLCHISESIREIFEIMRFDDLFDICESEDEAVIELME